MNALNYVNTRIGTYNEPRYSNGNILPLVNRPFGMSSFTIQNDGSLAPWFYNPYSHSFEGIRLTHQPSPWVNDFGQMLFLPFTGELNKNKNKRWSSFRPKEAIIMPHFLDVYLQRYNVNLKLSTSDRCAIFNLESKESNVGFAFISITESEFNVIGNEIIGKTITSTFLNKKKITQYFYAKFNSDIKKYEILENGGIAIYFNTKQLEIYLGCSFISAEQAKINYLNEISKHDFVSLKKESEKIWNDHLSIIEVSEEDEEKCKTFYSCLYRVLLFPQKFYEINENNEIIHFNLDTNTINKGIFYTNNGFWDTYRTVYPLLSIMNSNIVKEIIEGYINFAEETGYLPKWLSAYDICLMPGTLVEAIISDACVKGILKDELLERAYKILIREVFRVSNDGIHGRNGNDEYMSLGYVSNNYYESINNTCDCAYGDFCVAQVAKLVGDEKNYKILMERSKNYKNLFDAKYGFLRAKDYLGNFSDNFDPYEWGGGNCEGSSWQNSFAVYHDIEGLAELHGGKDKLIAKLDELFKANPKFTVGTYDNEIHEMSEMASIDFGQCAISNQPSFHIPWLYSYLGNKEKTEYWVKKISEELFSYKEDGFPGDEDNGTMSAWYIFACLGFYPMCPGKNEYVKSKKLFNQIKICGKEI